MIECQVHYVMEMLDAMDAPTTSRGSTLKRDVMDEYNGAIQRRRSTRVEGLGRQG